MADGAYFSLDKPELRRLGELIEEARALRDVPSESLRVSRFQAGLWDELAELGVVHRQARAWQQQVAGLLSIDALPPIPVPDTLDAQLRPYQLDGFRWLAFLWQWRLGGILADDMGLGKTVQTLALISHAKLTDPACAPFLVITPASVVANWCEEAHRFAPGLSVLALTDTVRRRGEPLRASVGDTDIVVTSYTLFRLDFDDYAELPWSGLILDEAQQVKNHQSKAYQCARRLPAPVKLAITGTPMENNLMELWSLLSITAPGLFPNPKRFQEFYAHPIEKQGNAELLGRLRRRMRPLVKRRTKEQVASDLPAKQEQVLEVQLHPRHRKLYQTQLQRERQKVLGPDRRRREEPVHHPALADPVAAVEPARGAGRRCQRRCAERQDRRPGRAGAGSDRRWAPGAGVQPVHPFSRPRAQPTGCRGRRVLLPRRPHPRPRRRAGAFQGPVALRCS